MLAGHLCPSIVSNEKLEVVCTCLGDAKLHHVDAIAPWPEMVCTCFAAAGWRHTDLCHVEIYNCEGRTNDDLERYSLIDFA